MNFQYPSLSTKDFVKLALSIISSNLIYPLFISGLKHFGPTNDKKAIETLFLAILRPRKSMGAIVIDICDKSNFFESFGLQKGAKNTIFVQGGL